MYKDKEAQREANRLKAQRHREREKGVTEGVTENNSNPQELTPVTPEIVTPDVLPVTPGWADVQAFILRDSPRMGNLERLQRIAGSLGKYADDVMYGISGLTMQDIGECIGTQPALYPVS